jgi:hypothetical protein
MVHPQGPARVDRKTAPAIFRRLSDPGGSAEIAKGPCGGIGRRARLKIEFRKECWFDSGQGHQDYFLDSGSEARRCLAPAPSSSLRTNGSGYCRPDGRLRDPYAVSLVVSNAVGRLSRHRQGLWLWVPAFAGTTQRAGSYASHTASRSRGAIRPRFAGNFLNPQNRRAQGTPGARCTRGLVCKQCTKKTHTSIQVQRRQSGVPCAMVFTAYSALSPVSGLDSHRRPRSLART